MDQVLAQPVRGYAICGEQRSGSNRLCELLTSTGLLGRPLDYFNGPGLRDKGRPDYPQDMAGQLDCVTRLGTTANGVYGVKLFSETVERIAPTRWAQRLPGLTFVWLERRDLLGQAISSARAAQTSQYRANAPVRAEPRYDRDQIRTQLHRLALGTGRWAAFFAQHGLAPLRLTYEEVSQDPQGAVDRVSASIGLGGRPLIDSAALALMVQRDEISRSWRERFLAEAGDPSTIDRIDGPSLCRRAEDWGRRTLRSFLGRSRAR